MSRNHRRIPTIAMLLCLLPVLAAAQSGTVYGTVNDDQGKAARGVQVALENPKIGFRQRTTTAADGGFRFREVPPASGYQVTALIQQKVVSARSLNLNVGDHKEVWPPLVILPPAEKPTVSPDSTPSLATAVIYGRIFDSRFKPLAGAEVKLQNETKNFSQAQATTEDGSYRFDPIPAGEGYRLVATAGDRSDARYPIEVMPDEEKYLRPLLLIPDKAVAVEVVSSAISGVITGDQLQALPLYNRNFLALGLLTPETHDVEQGSDLAGASFSIAGARASSNNFLLDGSDNVASGSNQAVPFQVNDSIQEFRVISSNAPAEFGRNLGGVVNVATHRGTSAFHGSAYGYFANDALNADGPLSVYNGTTFNQAAAYAGSATLSNLGTGPPPAPQISYFPLRYNDYVNIARNNGFCTNSIVGPLLNPSGCVAANAGANTFFDPATIRAANDRRKSSFDSKQFGTSAGGPLKKDKLFVFGSYEGTRINNPNPVFERVPTAFDKSYNPLNAPTSFASLPTPRTMFSPTSPDYLLAQKVFSLFPAPNVVGVPGVLEFFQGEAPNYTHVHNILARADWSKSEKTAISLRYVTQVLEQLHNASLPAPASPGGYPGNGAIRHAFNQNLAFVVKQTLGASMINEARFGLNRFNVRETAQDAAFDARSLGVASNNFPNAAMPTILLSGLDPQYSGAYLGRNGAFGSWAEILNGGFLSPQPNPSPMAPSLDGLFPFARIGAPLNTPSARIDTTFAFADSLSFDHGRHDMKLGFSFRILTNRVRNEAYQRGFIYSSNIGAFGHDSQSCNQVCTARVADPSVGPYNAPPNGFLRPSFDFARFDDAPLAGDFHSRAWAGFFQDAWRVGTHITLNLGVRYEYSSPPQEASGRTWNFDPVAGGLVATKGSSDTVDPYGNRCGSSQLSDRMFPSGGFHLSPPGTIVWKTNCTPSGNQTTVPPKRMDFAPRLGIAWDVFGNGKTVVRAGAGMFWDQLPASYLSQLIFNRPVTGNNAVYGQIIDSRACPTGTFALLATGCGLGNSLINPGRRSQSDLAGTQPNSFFSEAAFPSAMYARDTANSGTPYALQTNLTVQHQLSNKLAVEGGYIGTLGRRLPVVFNRRAASELSFAGGDPPIYSFPVFTMTNQGESAYHSFVARLRAAQWHGLRLNSTYVFSRSVDNALSGLFYPEPVTPAAIAAQKLVSTGNPGSACFFRSTQFVTTCIPTTFPSIDLGGGGALTTTGAGQILVTPYTFSQDPFHFLSDDRGPSDFDVPHRLVLDYTWEVPSPRNGSTWSKWLDRWFLSGIFVAQAGQPFTIFSAPPAAAELTQRVNIVGGGPTFNMSDPNAAIVSNATNGVVAALPGCDNRYLLVDPGTNRPLSPPTACTGNSGRNSFRGPGYINLDFAVQKGFLVQGENKMLIFRGELYNLFNRANYYNPISKFSADGVNASPEFGQIKSAHDPRKLQFAMRFSW